MDTARLQSLLARYADHRILIFGDFFLDRYLIIDPALNEVSIETGKIAYQVVEKRPQPGAAGTVCNNLSALGVGTMTALSVIGDDGEGYELRQALEQRRVDPSQIIVSKNRFTPTYTKPMLRKSSGDEELNREDIKNRSPLPEDLERELQKRLAELAPHFDAVILADQVQERNCGVLTDPMREFIADLAPRCPNTLFFADSRERIAEFRNVTVKPNRFEAAGAEHSSAESVVPTQQAIACAQRLRQITARNVFLTLDKEGICPISGEEPMVIPCPPVTGPIDIVGAGDSVTAGIVSALCSGATPREAAIIGNLTASITIRQLGTTGTATPEQVIEAWEANGDLYNA